MDIYQRIMAAVALSAADQGISMAELARAIGIDDLRQRELSSGRSSVSRSEMVLACEFLELDIAEAGSVCDGPGIFQ